MTAARDRLRHRTRAAAALLAAAVVVASCGADDDASTADDPSPADDQADVELGEALATTVAPPELDGSVPPVDAINAAPLFADEFARLGVRLTNRGGLINRRGGRYVKSTGGQHYALYVEPTGDYSIDDYVDGLVELTRVTAPLLFARYPGLESYDICQEPNSSEDDSPYPPPITQVDLTREQAATVDWEAFDLDALFSLRASGATVAVSEPVAAHPDIAPLLDDGR